MFKQARNIPFPENDKLVIWRFVDFAQFVDLLDSSCLYFSRLDSLDDPFEARSTPMDFLKKEFPEEVFKVSARVPAKGGTRGRLQRWWAEKSREMEQENLVNTIRSVHLDETYWVNCWHAGDDDTVALWKIHAAAGKNLAIRSTVGALRDAIVPAEPGEISIGRVAYDETGSRSSTQGPVGVALSKDRRFAYEREIRAVLGGDDRSLDGWGRGIKVPVDKQTLVNTVVVSANAEDWFCDLTERVMRAYGLDAYCQTSRPQPTNLPVPA